MKFFLSVAEGCSDQFMVGPSVFVERRLGFNRCPRTAGYEMKFGQAAAQIGKA